jgi:hypothetical protein
MKLMELAEKLNLQNLTPQVTCDAEVTGGYASDLLSDVLVHAPTGGVLITLQVHLNVIAVAIHAGLLAVIFSSGRMPEQNVIERAASENLCLFATAADTFEVVGRLYEMGLRGRQL